MFVDFAILFIFGSLTCYISRQTVLTMRFFLSCSLLATAATIAAVDNLFDDSFSDASGFLDIPQDGLQDVSQDALPDWTSEDLKTIQDDNLFSDSAPMEFVSTTTDLASLDLLASCPVDGAQSSGTLRARDGENSCANPVPLQGGLRETLDRLRRLWSGEIKFDLMKPTSSDPSPEGPPPPGIIPTEPADNNKCRADYPYHVCCEQRGAIIEEREDMDIFEDFQWCQNSM